MSKDMRFNAIVVMMMLVAGCGNPDVCGVPLCPEGTVLADCDKRDDSCTEYDPGKCSYRCQTSEVVDPCQDAAAPADCPDGYDQVDECPPDATCVTQSGCSPEFDRICAPRTSFDGEAFYSECDVDGCAPVEPTCDFDEDCQLVPAGDVCAPCVDDCPSGVVLAADAQSYNTEFEQLQSLFCEEPEACAADCLPVVASCEPTSRTCVVREAEFVRTTDAPKDCTVAADCALVFSGEVCDPCRCANDAVRADYADTYNEAFDVECLTNSQCRCDPPSVECVMGVCTAMR